MAGDRGKAVRKVRMALGIVGCVLLVVGLVLGPNGGLPRYMLPICLVLGLALVMIAVLAPGRWMRRR